MYEFNPFDSDTFPDPDHFDEEAPYVLDEQGNPVSVEGPVPAAIFPGTDSSSSDENPHVASDPSSDAIHMTDLKNIRTVLSILTRYPGGVLSNHLKQFPGLIILPLDAVSMLRKPTGNHIANPTAILYVPNGSPEEYSIFNNFNEAIRLLQQTPQ